MSKKSIRFFNNREVRAINDESDYVKAGNYWRWLKKKFNKEGVQLVSVTHEFKFEAPDGKGIEMLPNETLDDLLKRVG